MGVCRGPHARSPGRDRPVGRLRAVYCGSPGLPGGLLQRDQILLGRRGGGNRKLLISSAGVGTWYLLGSGGQEGVCRSRPAVARGPYGLQIDFPGSYRLPGGGQGSRAAKAKAGGGSALGEI